MNLHEHSALNPIATLTNQVGVCTKTTEGRVTYQNGLCKQYCGDQTGKVCLMNCLKNATMSRGQIQLEKGLHLSSSQEFNGSSYDSLLISTENEIITLLYLLDAAHENRIEQLKSYPLSKRELEIAGLMIRGSSNVDMAKKLFISPATLRTHLNNIYKKLPQELSREIQENRARQRKGSSPTSARAH